MVTSSFGSRELRVTIQVNDVNDPPVFSLPSYSAKVEEDKPVGASVLQVSATDSDEGQFGAVSYSLQAGQPSGGMTHHKSSLRFTVCQRYCEIIIFLGHKRFCR